MDFANAPQLLRFALSLALSLNTKLETEEYRINFN